jgi:3-keto-L-gulonate-6-phosphate decarboxylase
MTRTGQTVYIEAAAEEITAVKVSRKTSIETASEEAVSKIVNIIIDMIYYHHSLNKRSAIYIGNLNAS